MMRRGMVTGLFILANLLLVVLVLLLGLRDSLTEWRNMNATIGLMESRLSVKERNLEAYADNRVRLVELEAEADNARVILPYDGLAAAMENVRLSARGRGLIETAFETREPVTYETGEDGEVVEVKAEAAYTGAYGDICAFARELTESRTGYRIERLTLALDTAAEGQASARLDFYVYAAEAGEAD